MSGKLSVHYRLKEYCSATIPSGFGGLIHSVLFNRFIGLGNEF
jgi:hypothetical protein